LGSAYVSLHSARPVDNLHVAACILAANICATANRSPLARPRCPPSLAANQSNTGKSALHSRDHVRLPLSIQIYVLIFGKALKQEHCAPTGCSPAHQRGPGGIGSSNCQFS